MVDYIILAGYVKLIPSQLVQRFPRAILNIHPGLLPSFGGKGFYGNRVHKAVIASGARFSGPTVHFIDEEYDTGPILAQAVVPVYPTDSPDTLATRVLQQACVLNSTTSYSVWYNRLLTRILMATVCRNISCIPGVLLHCVVAECPGEQMVFHTCMKLCSHDMIIL